MRFLLLILLAFNLALQAGDFPHQICLQQPLTAYDLKNSTRVIGQFEVNTTLQVLRLDATLQMYQVVYEDPSGQKVEAFCRAENVKKELAAENPSPAADAPSPAPVAPHPANAPLKTGEFMTHFEGNSPKVTHKHAWMQYQFNLGQESFDICVPPNYDGTQDFGILSFINAGDAMTLPQDWAPVLEERKLLFVAPQGVGNEQKVERRMGLALVGILKMMEKYKVDHRRVYTTGFSGGARTSLRLSFLHPEWIAGNLPICGADFNEAVPRVDATNQDADYGLGLKGLDATLISKARQKVRFALITGETDFRRGNIRDIFNGGFQKHGFKAKLFDVPGMGHAICSADILRQALDFVEGGVL